MPDLIVGAGDHIVIDPPDVPSFLAPLPTTSSTVVLPIGGPRGPAGPAGQAEVDDPPIDLVVLFDNALA